MRTKITICLLICISSFCFSQTEECGTEFTNTDKLFLENNKPLVLKSGSKTASTIRYIAVQHHIVRTTGKTGGLNTNAPAQIINELNEAYRDADIQFYTCNEINYINSTFYYDFLKTDANEKALRTAENVSGAINVYYFNSITKTDSKGLAGYTHYPAKALSFVAITNSYALNGSTVIHEFGHFFGIRHTHSEDGETGELVTRGTGANCSIAADNFCDTPADPGLNTTVVNSSCVYTGRSTDMNGDTYLPNTHNYMSYSRKACRDEFSTEQLEEADSWAGSTFHSSFIHTTTVPSGTLTSDLTVTDNVIILDGVAIGDGSHDVNVVLDGCHEIIFDKDFEIHLGSTLTAQ